MNAGTFTIALCSATLLIAAAPLQAQKPDLKGKHQEMEAKQEQMKKEMRAMEDKQRQEMRDMEDRHHGERKTLRERHMKERASLQQKMGFDKK